jgi:hypothetical protein
MHVKTWPEGGARLTSGNIMHYCKAIQAALLVGFLAIPQASAQTKSESRSLSGAWSGGGTVRYSSGQRERARCQVHYSGGGGSQVTASATCATPSGSISQTARLRKTGPNSYSGSFFSPQYNVGGHIHVTTHGNRQSVSISSGSGSASLSLSH